MNWTTLLVLVQLFFGVVIGLYFWNLLRNQHSQKSSIDKESKKEMEQLRKLRNISLTEPLSERVRPLSMDDIVGQKDGIQTLRAALCGPNPQHVIIYGSPGVGKTAAARLVLEEAKRNWHSPFKPSSVFVELDATTARFDERGIADPLIGSVHDPIYQGAGAMGQAGIPQPKQGAVTHAHGGVLFIDEIGELHPIQMNKLLKVLEDRKVFLESAYYSEENTQIPPHIHDIFQNGLPADFRLIGATTRSPEEIPPAIRSRCLEVFFNDLKIEDIKVIARRAAEKLKIKVDEACMTKIAEYARNGREVTNIMQITAGIAISRNTETITLEDIEWVIQSSQLQPKPDKKVHNEAVVGLVNGLAVYGPNRGALLEIEVTATRSRKGSLTITGIVEEETMGSQTKSIRRKSLVKSSIENVITVLNKMGVRAHQYHIHVNFPGGAPVDGPSAGIAIATAIYSAIKNIPIDPFIAMTGELSIHGAVKPIGGAMAKIEAARDAGAKRVIIPQENYQSLFKEIKDIEIITVGRLTEVLSQALQGPIEPEKEDVIPATSQFQSPSQSV
ncbi:Lon-like ATP-dependent protease [Pullulanibacillus pueri]|uniref:endopeptidase La n=1 Tax=Pullulanibacillus pueri TaxID=1437324 RepID=A0A8J2ZWF8_9BACL|nr:ATP-dependent protease LonB [Pullulanibacillus pueri]MBM7681911.1 Lon-like ATP-dependent protease [Pullulanibacillus pueri]GGH83412.1 Lon protease 2 [Pullulanibacillus pueri]